MSTGIHVAAGFTPAIYAPIKGAPTSSRRTACCSFTIFGVIHKLSYRAFFLGHSTGDVEDGQDQRITEI